MASDALELLSRRLVERFGGRVLPLVVLAVGQEEEEGEELVFGSEWLDGLEGKLTAGEREELEKHLSRASRVLMKPFERMVKEDVDLGFSLGPRS